MMLSVSHGEDEGTWLVVWTCQFTINYQNTIVLQGFTEFLYRAVE